MSQPQLNINIKCRMRGTASVGHNPQKLRERLVVLESLPPTPEVQQKLAFLRECLAQCDKQ